MPGTFSPPRLKSDPDMHHGTCVTHVPWCMPGSLPSGFLWSRWRRKRSRHSRRMCNPQFYVSGKTPIAWIKGGLATYIYKLFLCRNFIERQPNPYITVRLSTSRSVLGTSKARFINTYRNWNGPTWPRSFALSPLEIDLGVVSLCFQYAFCKTYISFHNAFLHII